MILLNDAPSEEWKQFATNKDSELYVEGNIRFENLRGSLIPRSEIQNLVAYALRIDAYDTDLEM